MGGLKEPVSSRHDIAPGIGVAHLLVLGDVPAALEFAWNVPFRFRTVGLRVIVHERRRVALLYMADCRQHRVVCQGVSGAHQKGSLTVGTSSFWIRVMLAWALSGLGLGEHGTVLLGMLRTVCTSCQISPSLDPVSLSRHVSQKSKAL